MTLPKPKFCGQNWLDMKPTDNGRICGGCQKNIIDFSKMTFSEIEKIQSANNNSICGKYSNKQLNNWGQEINNQSISKKIVIAASAIIVASTQVKAENKVVKDDQYYLSRNISNGDTTDVNTLDDSTKTSLINGYIYERDSLGIKTPVAFASIFFESRKIGTTTDLDGYFELKTPVNQSKNSKDTLTISAVEYLTTRVLFDSIPKGSKTLNIELKKSITSITSFYVRSPSIKEKIGWRVRRLFRKSK